MYLAPTNTTILLYKHCALLMIAFAVQLFFQGTLELEITLAKGVMGVVSRDVKGSGQGVITVTDGNNLEVPLSLRFPKVSPLACQ